MSPKKNNLVYTNKGGIQSVKLLKKKRTTEDEETTQKRNKPLKMSIQFEEQSRD